MVTLNKAKTTPFGLSPSILFIYLNFVIKTKSENVIFKKKKRNMPKPDESVCQTEKIGGRREKRVRDRQMNHEFDRRRRFVEE